MVAFGSPIRDGNQHDPKNVPIVLAGNANKQIKTGRHLEFDAGTPLCSLWLSMLEKAGVTEHSFADATTALRGV